MKYDPRGKSGKPGMVIMIGVKGKKDKEEKKKYGSMPMKKAWEVFKALPEQQQYQEMPGLGEGFEQATPQRRIGTVPPAIISMLRRLQSGEGPGPTRPGKRSVGYDASFTDDRPMPNLKTFHADPLQDIKGMHLPNRSKIRRKYLNDEVVRTRDVPRPNRAARPYGHLVEMPGRRAHPGFETYGNETAMSPQFLDPTIHEPFVEGYSDPNMESVVAGPQRTSGTGLAVPPPKGSPHALLYLLHEVNPEGMKKLIEASDTYPAIPTGR